MREINNLDRTQRFQIFKLLFGLPERGLLVWRIIVLGLNLVLNLRILIQVVRKVVVKIIATESHLSLRLPLRLFKDPMLALERGWQEEIVLESVALI